MFKKAALSSASRVLLAGVISLISAYVSAAESGDDNLQVVYICRPSTFFGGLHSPFLYLDDEPLGELKNGSRYRIERLETSLRFKLYYKKSDNHYGFVADLDSSNKPQYLIFASVRYGGGSSVIPIGKTMVFLDDSISAWIGNVVTEAEFMDSCRDYEETTFRSTKIQQQSSPTTSGIKGSPSRVAQSGTATEKSPTRSLDQPTLSNTNAIPKKLRELQKLKQDDVITEAEYRTKKKALLDSY